MRNIDKNFCSQVITKILRDFGNGVHREGHYIFDDITRLPEGMTDERIAASKLADELKCLSEIFIIFDPHPNNRINIDELSHQLNAQSLDCGVAVSSRELSPFFAATECDFYLTNHQGELLAVACHEDTVQNSERFVWRPRIART